jgi:hypothetical protein
MNKAAGIGAVIVIIIGIIIVSATVSNDSVPVEETVDVEETIPVEETVDVEETIPVEETVDEDEGKNITVELTESIGLKGP